MPSSSSSPRTPKTPGMASLSDRNNLFSPDTPTNANDFDKSDTDTQMRDFERDEEIASSLLVQVQDDLTSKSKSNLNAGDGDDLGNDSDDSDDFEKSIAEITFTTTTAKLMLTPEQPPMQKEEDEDDEEEELVGAESPAVNVMRRLSPSPSSSSSTPDSEYGAEVEAEVRAEPSVTPSSFKVKQSTPYKTKSTPSKSSSSTPQSTSISSSSSQASPTQSTPTTRTHTQTPTQVQDQSRSTPLPKTPATPATPKTPSLEDLNLSFDITKFTVADAGADTDTDTHFSHNNNNNEEDGDDDDDDVDMVDRGEECDDVTTELPLSNTNTNTNTAIDTDIDTDDIGGDYRYEETSFELPPMAPSSPMNDDSDYSNNANTNANANTNNNGNTSSLSSSSMKRLSRSSLGGTGNGNLSLGMGMAGASRRKSKSSRRSSMRMSIGGIGGIGNRGGSLLDDADIDVVGIDSVNVIDSVDENESNNIEMNQNQNQNQNEIEIEVITLTTATTNAINNSNAEQSINIEQLQTPQKTPSTSTLQSRIQALSSAKKGLSNSTFKRVARRNSSTGGNGSGSGSGIIGVGGSAGVRVMSVGNGNDEENVENVNAMNVNGMNNEIQNNSAIKQAPRRSISIPSLPSSLSTPLKNTTQIQTQHQHQHQNEHERDHETEEVDDRRKKLQAYEHAKELTRIEKLEVEKQERLAKLEKLEREKQERKLKIELQRGLLKEQRRVREEAAAVVAAAAAKVEAEIGVIREREAAAAAASAASAASAAAVVAKAKQEQEQAAEFAEVERKEKIANQENENKLIADAQAQALQDAAEEVEVEAEVEAEAKRKMLTAVVIADADTDAAARFKAQAQAQEEEEEEEKRLTAVVIADARTEADTRLKAEQERRAAHATKSVEVKRKIAERKAIAEAKTEAKAKALQEAHDNAIVAAAAKSEEEANATSEEDEISFLAVKSLPVAVEAADEEVVGEEEFYDVAPEEENENENETMVTQTEYSAFSSTFARVPAKLNNAVEDVPLPPPPPSSASTSTSSTALVPASAPAPPKGQTSNVRSKPKMPVLSSMKKAAALQSKSQFHSQSQSLARERDMKAKQAIEGQRLAKERLKARAAKLALVKVKADEDRVKEVERVRKGREDALVVSLAASSVKSTPRKSSSRDVDTKDVIETEVMPATPRTTRSSTLMNMTTSAQFSTRSKAATIDYSSTTTTTNNNSHYPKELTIAKSPALCTRSRTKAALSVKDLSSEEIEYNNIQQMRRDTKVRMRERNLYKAKSLYSLSSSHSASNEPKALTIPEHPNFRTDARYGSKTASASGTQMDMAMYVSNPISAAFKSPTHRLVSTYDIDSSSSLHGDGSGSSSVRRLTVPEPFVLSESARKAPAKDKSRVDPNTPLMAERAADFYKSLHSVTKSNTNRAVSNNLGRAMLTEAMSPNWTPHPSSKKVKSTDELEEELMERFRRNALKVKSKGVSDSTVAMSGSAKKGRTEMSSSLSRDEEECKKKFKSIPMPDFHAMLNSSANSNNSASSSSSLVTPKRELTTPKSPSFSTNNRMGKREVIQWSSSKPSPSVSSSYSSSKKWEVTLITPFKLSVSTRPRKAIVSASASTPRRARESEAFRLTEPKSPALMTDAKHEVYLSQLSLKLHLQQLAEKELADSAVKAKPVPKTTYVKDFEYKVERERKALQAVSPKFVSKVQAVNRSNFQKAADDRRSNAEQIKASLEQEKERGETEELKMRRKCGVEEGGMIQVAKEVEVRDLYPGKGFVKPKELTRPESPMLLTNIRSMR